MLYTFFLHKVFWNGVVPNNCVKHIVGEYVSYIKNQRMHRIPLKDDCLIGRTWPFNGPLLFHCGEVTYYWDTPSTGSSCLRTVSMAVACASSKGDPKMSQNVNLPNLKISSKRRVWWCLGVSKKFLTNDKHHKSQCFFGQQITCLIGFSWRHGLVFVTFQPWKER